MPETPPDRSCARCAQQRIGYFRYCLSCGFDYDAARRVAPVPVAPKPIAPVPVAPAPAAAAPVPVPVAAAPVAPVAPAPVAPEPAAPAPGILRPVLRTSATPALAEADAVDPSTQSGLPQSIPRRRIARSAVIWTAAAILGLMALSDMTTRSASQALDSPRPTGALSTSVASTVGPSPSPSTVVPTDGLTAQPSVAATLSPISFTTNDQIEINERAPELFGGSAGTYTWVKLAFVADRLTVDWNVSAGPDADCQLRFELQPGSGTVIAETIDVRGADLVTGDRQYDTTFSDAAFVVVNTCERWEISMFGG